MTKEELKEEAEEKAKKRTKGFKYQDNCEKSYVMGALDFAEPREKRIAELELKIKHLTKHLDYQDICDLFEQVEDEVKQEQKLKKLELENAELKEQNNKVKAIKGEGGWSRSDYQFVLEEEYENNRK